MYYHQAIIQPYQNQFRGSVVKDFNNNTNKNRWRVVSIKEVTTRTRIIYGIWSIKLKIYILSRIVMKWKSSITIYREQKDHGLNYTEPYSYVASCYTIRTILTQDQVHPKMSPTLLLSGMYQKSFIYHGNRTNYE